MRITLLPSHCTHPEQLQPLTTFLVNGTVAIDAGCLGIALSLDQQRRIHHIIITHAHSDHTATLPIFVAEVFPFLETPIVVHAIAPVIEALRAHIFNDAIWPNFGQIPLLNGAGPALIYHGIETGIPFEVEGLRITMVQTNHTVPCAGLAVVEDEVTVLFTSDTHHTDDIWQLANRLDNLKAIFVDVSYPNELENLAAAAKHLTPQSLDEELHKLQQEIPIYAVHLKPQFHTQVSMELQRLNRKNVFVAEIGREYVW
ncbi:MAG: 3',5'-cyclic-nucleotide phosphodiesterase [Acidobacteria bacterium]|nr:MAG: 3',5'-cyclic-nucleotide phosphodiesterase [Acidobacteriota bacterium]